MLPLVIVLVGLSILGMPFFAVAIVTSVTQSICIPDVPCIADSIHINAFNRVYGNWATSGLNGCLACIGTELRFNGKEGLSSDTYYGLGILKEGAWQM